MRLGFHVQIAGGWEKTLQRAVDRRCTTLQVFTSAPVQWARKPLDPAGAAWFAEQLRARDIQPLFVHAIYLLNLATAEEQLWQRSRDNLAEELHRAGLLGAQGVVVHLGSVGAQGDLRQGIRRVARALDSALAQTNNAVTVLLENCAGQGNLVGCTPQALGEVIAHTRYPSRLQVCLDTAHAFAAGYPIHTEDGLGALLEECDAAFGLERLALIHANDSKGALGCNVDRHWHIGRGQIGREGFRVILNAPRLRQLAFIMETPSSEEWDARNMRVIRRLVDPHWRPKLPPKR
jgi:deoxyribonuclease-4